MNQVPQSGVAESDTGSDALKTPLPAVSAGFQSCLDKAEEHAAHASLLDILNRRRIQTVFQPIYNLHSGEVFAYEALSRVVGPSPFQNPEALFRAASRFGRTPQLEELCLRTALDSALRQGIDQLICLNICPSLLLQDRNPQRLSPLLEELHAVREKIVLELTERFFIRNDSLFVENVRFYQDQGFRIAIDDLGCGFTGLKMLAQMEPAMVKMDRFLVSDIQESTQKRMLLESLVSFCHKISAMVVAEGIETEAELDVLLDLRVDFGQGYLLGRPEAGRQTCPDVVRSRIMGRGTLLAGERYPDNHLGSLAEPVEPAVGSDCVSKLVERFESNGDLSAIPVVQGDRPVGIVHRVNLFQMLGRRYGYSLHMNKPVQTVMEPALILEWNTLLDDVSRTVLRREEQNVYDAMIVVRGGVYVGIVKVFRILEAITEQKLKMALQANPLTGLPGNNLIKEEITGRLARNEIFAVLYFDLDHFKPFNDCFGFDHGDRVIRFLGNFLRERLKRWDQRAFIGHVGGDDFVAVCRAQGVERFCRQFLVEFEGEIASLHDPATVQRGYYTGLDRHGNLQEFPLLTLSIAILTNQHRVFSSYGHLVSVASEVKKKAKQIPGNSFYTDQRCS